MGPDLLISDLHLSQERPLITGRLREFLSGEAAGARSLYILGDLFDYWVGDDALRSPDGDPLAREVVAALHALARGGTALHLMQGNRDFLLGNEFLSASGALPLADPAIAEVGGVKTLLMHGDTLCTDDRDYMAWRSTARSAAWQADFLAAPIDERRARSRALRTESEARKRSKSAAIMDVNQDAVREAFRRHAVTRMIHGHTHRPGHHELELDGLHCERWVLPDWYQTGGYLRAENGTARLVRFAPAPG
ncbi:MAG TPA: UDP-2,3-diacylglucosamine diphosphatase [Burkholderiales bacterium]|nr:UDP-2,3-diacylglucosamine diphosphatase [Burkholderiales bacterium]